ncbi:hypothetical protein, partial [Enterobacter chengduensis]|uniref:hypothetical protein n=1 Tax=Enterobacter chengduensis TaxID=2494701 RepID=UPI001A95C105
HELPAELRAIKRPLSGGPLFSWRWHLNFRPAFAVRKAPGVPGHSVQRGWIIPAHELIPHFVVGIAGASAKKITGRH